MKKLNLLPVIALFLLVLACSQSAFAQFTGIKPELIFYRHNSAPGGPVPAVSTDTIGTIWFNALTATNKVRTGASIRSFITGPVSATSLPANLVFRTGATSQVNRMVVTATGLVGIGTMAPIFHLDVVGNTHTSGDFYGRIHIDDTQLTNAAPNTYNDETYFERKQRTVLGVPGIGGTHGGLMTLAPGGTSNDHQLFFGDDGIYHRRWTGSAPNWTGSTWFKLLTGEDINGTTNRVAKFTGPHSLGNSQIWDEELGVAINAVSITPGFRFDVNGNTRINGNQLLTANLTVQGSATVTGATTLNGVTSINNSVTVSGATTLNGLVTVNNSATISGTLGVGSNATVGGTLSVTNNANVGNSLSVNNNTNVGGNADVSGTAHIGGKVSIGTTNTVGTHALYVGGSIVAEEVKVALQMNWPDYVFAENAPTPNPMEWEKFIKANKHLPGIPSAQEVAQNGGIELGETQRLLLEKIEQLTLMLIDQQKQIETLKAGNGKQ